MLRASQASALPPSLPSSLVAPSRAGCLCRFPPRKHVGARLQPTLGWRRTKAGQQGPRPEPHAPFSAPASLMGAGMSLGKLRERAGPSRCHACSALAAKLEPPPTHCLVSKTHKSWGAAGSPQHQWGPWLQPTCHGRNAPGGILQLCPSSLGDLLECDIPPSPHILELPSIPWVLSHHAAKTGQAVDK